ncbi:MAG: YihY/virulence factor BrkB family protein [Clostridiales bacterium]|nr:YihY/virulence factor BrkB family protein [Clostridiales bacterium]
MEKIKNSRLKRRQKRKTECKNSVFLRLNVRKNEHTYRMEKLRSFYYYLREKYDLLSLKKYTTIAGTLVFFLIMSIVPLSFWITLVVGRLPIDPDKVLSLPVFDSVKDILSYIRQEAASATASASVILVFTTLYSSTNLFYQMRRSGELIYDYHRERQGIKLRIGALVLLIVVMATVVAFLLMFALGSLFFSRILSKTWERIADYTLLTAVAFLLVLLLNIYICPYKAKIRSFLPGTLLTVGAWIIAIVGFTIYLQISNVDRLYGALSALIIFLLWLYILMICFIVGVILNSERVLKETTAKKRKGIKTTKSHILGL